MKSSIVKPRNYYYFAIITNRSLLRGTVALSMKREDQGVLAIVDHHHLHQREGNTALYPTKEVHKREVRHHQGTIEQPMVPTVAGALKMTLEWMTRET